MTEVHRIDVKHSDPTDAEDHNWIEVRETEPGIFSIVKDSSWGDWFLVVDSGDAFARKTSEHVWVVGSVKITVEWIEASTIEEIREAFSHLVWSTHIYGPIELK